MDSKYVISEINVLLAHLERLKRGLEQEGESSQPAQSGQPAAPMFDPEAKSTGDLVTPKQLGLIRALAREAKLDPDEECQHAMKTKTESLSKRAASQFIDHLKNCVVEIQQPRKAS